MESGAALLLPAGATASTRLADCEATAIAVKWRDGAPPIAEVTRRFSCQPNFYHNTANASAVVVDTFAPGPGGAFNWTTAVSSPTAANWSTAIVSTLAVAAAHPEQARVWLGGPAAQALPNATFDPLLQPYRPLGVGPVVETFFFYGGKRSDVNDPDKSQAPSMHIPVMAAFPGGTSLDSPSPPAAVSLVQSLEDVPITSYATAALNGSTLVLEYVRQYHRLEAGLPAPLVFHQYVLPHAASWRPAVAFLQQLSPGFFALPPARAAQRAHFDGLGAYADLRGPADISAADGAHYRKLGLRFNWDSTARFPFHGEWIPTPQDGFNGTDPGYLVCFAHDRPDGHYNEGCSHVTYAEVSSWYAHLRQLGINTCVYGNLFEFGWQVAANWPPNKAKLDCSQPQHDNSSILACASQRLMAAKYGPALLDNPRRPGSPICGGLDGSCIFDPSPSQPYYQHLLDMVATSLQETPAEGVCIDRQDWIGQVNVHPAPGEFPETWFPVEPGRNFRAARSMAHSWMEAMPGFADAWHAAGRLVLINDHVNRLGMMEHVDGIFAEMGDLDPAEFSHAMGSALAALNKPVVIWDHAPKTAVPETALQAHLLYGIYPMAPVRNNDHAIGGDCEPNCPAYDQVFADYAPLFALLAGKEWVLNATAVGGAGGGGGEPGWIVGGGGGRVNVFRVAQADLLVVVTHCPTPSVQVQVQLDRPGGVVEATGRASFPGGRTAQVQLSQQAGASTVEFALEQVTRGVVLVEINYAGVI